MPCTRVMRDVMYQFSVATVTKYYRLVGLKTIDLFSYISGIQNLKSVSEARIKSQSLWRLQSRIRSFLFKPWWLLAFLGMWSHHSNLCLITFCHINFLLPLSYKDTCIYLFSQFFCLKYFYFFKDTCIQGPLR